MVFALGLGAAVLLAVGFVLQQHAAEAEPSSLAFSPRLLLDLLRRPLWLGGIASMISGDVIGAIALGNADVALVEPLLAANLFFALPLAAAWHRCRLAARDWVGAVLLVAGLAAFVIAGDPHGGSPKDAGTGQWLLALAVVVPVAGALVALGRGRRASRRATTAAAAAGTLFGLQDTLTSSVVHRLDGGLLRVIVSWQTYLLLLIAIVGILLTQSAFELAPLAASLPALTAAEPLSGIGLGLSLFQEQLRIGPGPIAVAAIGLVAMVGGIWVLGRSPLVTGVVAERAGNVRC